MFQFYTLTRLSFNLCNPLHQAVPAVRGLSRQTSMQLRHVYVAAGLIRAIFLFLELDSYFALQRFVSTSDYSLNGVKESIFMVNLGLFSHASFSLNASPLLAYFYGKIDSLIAMVGLIFAHRLIYGIIHGSVDIATAHLLYLQCMKRTGRNQESLMIVTTLLFSPFSLLAFNSSTWTWLQLLCVGGVHALEVGSILACTICFSLVFFLSPTIGGYLLLLPLIRSPMKALSAFVLVTLVQLGIFLELGGGNFGNYLEIFSRLFVPFMSPPALGLWWYLRVEVFLSFRQYFALLSVLVLIFFQAALFVFLRHHFSPHFAVAFAILCHCTFSYFVSYQSWAFATSCLLQLLHRYSAKQTSWMLIGLFVAHVVLALTPMIQYAWLNVGAGNANFLWALNMVLSAVGGILLLGLWNAEQQAHECNLKTQTD
jgi:hypothetical protein